MISPSLSRVLSLGLRNILGRIGRARMNSTEPKNQRYSVGPDGQTIIDLSFASEPLGMPASQGYGWPLFRAGEKIGPEDAPDRYTLLRKLGWGMHSSTWLARDAEDPENYLAVKALTGHMTEMDRKNLIWEQDALRLTSWDPQSSHCVYSTKTFTVTGSGSAGDHLCMATPLYGGDVKSLYEAHGRHTPFPLPLAKRILLHLLRGIAHAHSRDIVHADIKMDNILFANQMSTSEIDDWLDKNPYRLHDPETSYDGTVVQSVISQPLPMISLEDASTTTFTLGDLGCAQPSGLHTARTIIAPPLRPPEVFLGAMWDKPADIWSFGCLIYEITFANPLFHFTPHEQLNLNETENIIVQMLSITDEDPSAELLQRSPLAAEYFETSCHFRKFVPYKYPIEKAIRSWNVLEEAEVTSMASLIHRCLHMDPVDRATAEELLEDDWFLGVDGNLA